MNTDNIPLKSLIKYSPNSILQLLSNLELLNELRNYKIKSGDIILNIDNYETLEELINDAEFIYDNFDLYIYTTKNSYDIPIEEIKKSILLSRNRFYKEMALFLAKFPCEIFKELSEGKNIASIETKIKKRIVLI